MDAPEIIWLQRPCRAPENEWCGSATWCEDQQNDDDTKYIRADKLAALEAENARLTAELNLASGMAKAFQTEVAQQAEMLQELEHKEVFDADNPRFREVLEETFLAMGLPFKRQGETYRSPITRWCFHVAYGVVNRLRLYEK